MADVKPTKNLAAEELKKANTLPQPPANRCTWDQAEAYFNLLTPDQGQNVQTYVYRTKPVIVRQLSNPENKNYIDIVQGKIDRDYILSQHGGGFYVLHVTDNGASGKKLMEV